MFVERFCYSIVFVLATGVALAQVDSLRRPITTVPDSLELLRDSLAAVEAIDSLMQLEASAELSSEAAIAEDLSYRYYLSKEWEKLLPFTKKQFSIGNDYYFMRMRAGIAAYELKQYREACVHFEKALNFKPQDDIASEYLYFALVYCERNDEALQLRRTFSNELKQRLGFTKTSVLMSVFNETGLKTTDNANFENAFYTQLGLQHNVAGRFSLLHAGNYFMQNEKRFSVEQAQYYLRATAPLKKGFGIVLSGHAIQMNVKERVAYTTTVVATVPADPRFPNSGDTRTLVASINAETLIPIQRQSFIACAALGQEQKLFSWQLGGSFAQLDTARQLQLNVNAQVFPFKNNSFVLGSNVYWHQENQTMRALALAPYLVWHPVQKVYVSAAWFTNAGNNISEYNAQLFTNSIDYTRQRYSASLYYGLYSRLWLYGTMGYELKEHIKDNYSYAYYMYAVGLKLTFH